MLVNFIDVHQYKDIKTRYMDIQKQKSFLLYLQKFSGGDKNQRKRILK